MQAILQFRQAQGLSFNGPTPINPLTLDRMR